MGEGQETSTFGGDEPRISAGSTVVKGEARASWGGVRVEVSRASPSWQGGWASGHPGLGWGRGRAGVGDSQAEGGEQIWAPR